MVLFLLDEMYSHRTAEIGRRFDVDVLSIHELRRDGTPDEHVLLLAAEADRCVVTDNHKDFLLAHDHIRAIGLSHSGLLLVSGKVPHNAFAPLANAIVSFAREHASVELEPSWVRWLHVDLG